MDMQGGKKGKKYPGKKKQVKEGRLGGPIHYTAMISTCVEGGSRSTQPLRLLCVCVFFFLIFILRRMGKNKALLIAHHISTYFHTRRVSI